MLLLIGCARANSLQALQPEVVCLQEWFEDDARFDAMGAWRAGAWSVRRDGRLAQVYARG